MTFPLLEVKVSGIKREAAEPRTTAVVRVYRVDDGGIVEGQQQYARTLLRTRVVKRLGLLAPDADLSSAVRTKALAWLSELGLNLPADRLICSL